MGAGRDRRRFVGVQRVGARGTFDFGSIEESVKPLGFFGVFQPGETADGTN